MLQQLQIGTPADRSEIVNYKKANHYQLACLKHFNATHPKSSEMNISLDNVGNHPNAWLRASVALAQQQQKHGGESGNKSSSSAVGTSNLVTDATRDVAMTDSSQKQVSP